MINDVFVDYATNEFELVEAEKKVYNLRRLSDDLKKSIAEEDRSGAYALEFSAHAFRNISERIEDLAMQHTSIFKNVFRPDNPSDSVMAPSNMRVYVLGLLAKAHKDGRVNKMPSKNTPSSTEYHHVVEIDGWDDGDKVVQFTGIVENNVLKTGYFNWV